MSRRSCSSVDEVNFSSRAGSHCSYSMSISSRCTSIHFLPAEWHQLKLHFNQWSQRSDWDSRGVSVRVAGWHIQGRNRYSSSWRWLSLWTWIEFAGFTTVLAIWSVCKTHYIGSPGDWSSVGISHLSKGGCPLLPGPVSQCFFPC